MKSAHWTDKTLAEVKADIVARIGLRHPFLGVDPSIVHEVVERLTSLERDHWAEEWSRVAERFRLQGCGLRFFGVGRSIMGFSQNGCGKL